MDRQERIKIIKEFRKRWVLASNLDIALQEQIAEAELMERVSEGVELDILVPLGELGNRCYGEGKGEINTTIAIEVEKSKKKILDLCNAHWAGKLAGIKERLKITNEFLPKVLGSIAPIDSGILNQLEAIYKHNKHFLTTHLTAK